MNSILISMNPKSCSLVARHQKTLDVRKTKPRCGTPFKCYMYCTTKGDNLVSVNGKVQKTNHMIIDLASKYTKIIGLNGKVIGEFTCDKVIPLTPLSPEWKAASKKNKSMWYASTYDSEHELYGWRISDLIVYDKPKELSEFRLHDKTYDYSFAWAFNEKTAPLKRPPQSWCYVEELE